MMNRKIQFIVILSAVALVLLVLLQASWIRTAADLQEKQFDHQVSMALCRAVDNLKADTGLCNQVSECISKGPCIIPAATESPEQAAIDSVVEHALAFYNLDLNYQAQLSSAIQTIPLSPISSLGRGKDPFSCGLDELPNLSNWELQLFFPGKKPFLTRKLTFMLGASIVVILIISTFFSLSIYTVWKQQKIAQRNIDLINNLAHEFKTPLTNISLATRMVEKNNPNQIPPKTAGYLKVIANENQKLVGQVDRILNQTQLEYETPLLQKQWLNIHDILNDAIRGIRIQVEVRAGSIQQFFQARNPHIHCDVEAIRSAFTQLLDNANKYSLQSPQITITTEDLEDGVLVAVEDQGIGIRKEHQHHIFDKYYRAPTGDLHDVKGFGLGLNAARHIFQAHAGDIQVKSSFGKGTRFEIFLPSIP